MNCNGLENYDLMNDLQFSLKIRGLKINKLNFGTAKIKSIPYVLRFQFLSQHQMMEQKI